MKKCSFWTLVALAIAAVGVIIALAAYFKSRNDSYLFDEDDDDFLFDDPDDLEYYTSTPQEEIEEVFSEIEEVLSDIED